MKLVVAIDGAEASLTLDLPASVVLDARERLLGEADRAKARALADRIGLSLLVLGSSSSQALGLSLYADRGLIGMSSMALDLLSTSLGVDGLFPFAQAAAAAVLAPRSPPKVQTPSAARAPVRPPGPSIVEIVPDPYPGLRRQGQTWPEFLQYVGTDTSMATQNMKTEWKVAGHKWETGEIGAWMQDVGARLQFTWDPPPDYAPRRAAEEPSPQREG